jgi:hypothetical protein
VYALRNTLVLSELNGQTLKPERLSEAEGKELRGFIKHKLAHGEGGIEPLDAKEERRFEKLAGKAGARAPVRAQAEGARDAGEDRGRRRGATDRSAPTASRVRRARLDRTSSFVFDWLLNPGSGVPRPAHARCPD